MEGKKFEIEIMEKEIEVKILELNLMKLKLEFQVTLGKSEITPPIKEVKNRKNKKNIKQFNAQMKNSDTWALLCHKVYILNIYNQFKYINPNPSKKTYAKIVSTVDDIENNNWNVIVKSKVIKSSNKNNTEDNEYNCCSKCKLEPLQDITRGSLCSKCISGIKVCSYDTNCANKLCNRIHSEGYTNKCECGNNKAPCYEMCSECHNNNTDCVHGFNCMWKDTTCVFKH